jgi:hypothetical protein
VSVEHLCPPSSSFEREGRRLHRSPLESLGCQHDPSERMWKGCIRWMKRLETNQLKPLTSAPVTGACRYYQLGVGNTANARAMVTLIQ